MKSLQLNFLEPIKDQIKPPDGNQELVEYGIQNDQSDYRVHVGYKAQHIYVFPTSEGRRVLEQMRNILEEKTGSQDGVEVNTFKGYAIPLSALDNLQSILIPHDLYTKNLITQKDMTTSRKGHKAVKIVVEMLKRQLISLPINVHITDEKELQIKGTDIIVHSQLVLQVKCDFLAGERRHGGTGNIFLQTHECNPRRLI